MMQSPILHADPSTSSEQPKGISSIADLVRLHGRLEFEYDEAICQRDRLTRDICLSNEEPLRISEMTPQIFRERHSLAIQAVPAGRPNTARRFMAKLDSKAVEAYRDMELRVRHLQDRMSEVEREILERRPATRSGAICKLRFISACLIDTVELDQDYFAYLVEECAEVLDTAAT